MLTYGLIILAQASERYWRDDHMNGDWWVMALVMAAFWATVVVLIVWLVRGGGPRGAAVTRHETADEILRRRLADGSLSVEEYERRRTALKNDS